MPVSYLSSAALIGTSVLSRKMMKLDSVGAIGRGRDSGKKRGTEEILELGGGGVVQLL